MKKKKAVAASSEGSAVGSAEDSTLASADASDSAEAPIKTKKKAAAAVPTKKKKEATAASSEGSDVGSTEDSAQASGDASGSAEAPTKKKKAAVGSTEDSAMTSTEGSTSSVASSMAASDTSTASSEASAAGSGAESAMTVEDSVQLSERFGGPHGTNFSDQNFVNSGQTVSAISLHAGERLDGITLEISAPKTLTFNHGGTGGDQKTLKLEKGEYITSMEVHWSKHTAGTVITKDKTRIFYLNFATNLGNSLSGGTMTEQKTTVTAPKGFQLAGFFGSEGKGIDSLGAIWASIELSSGSGNMTIFIPKNTQPVQLSESFGGPHGKQFSDQLAVSSGMTVTSVTIRAAERLDRITLEVSAPKKMTFTHGRSGGKEDTLVLKDGEYITSIEAHLGKKRGATRVFYLRLGTSNGRSISGGTETEIKGSAEAPKGFQLAGFFGRFGDEIDLIGAVWASIAAVNGQCLALFQPMKTSLSVVEPLGLTYNHGGPGGEEITLALDAAEYINSMEVHWCKNDGRTQVCYVNFTTSEGKTVSVGTKTQQSATVAAPEGFQLSGLFGRAEDEVYQLGAIWTRMDAKPLLLTDTMDTAWHGDIIRNWVGPTVGVPKDNACYRKTQPMDSKNVCPLGYGRDDDDFLTKIASVANVAFNAATAGVLGNLKTVYTGATRVYMCAATVISVIKSLIYYFRFVQNTAPQGDTEQLLAVAYQSNVVLIDLPVAVYACLGKPPPPRMVWASYVLSAVQFIVKQTIINGDRIISSATNVVNLLRNATSVNSSANSVTELEDFIAANTSCGYELKKLTDRVIFKVNEVRNKTMNAAVDDIRVTISRSALVQHDIPRVTNNCMKEMMANKTRQAAFETRDLLRKTMGVIIDQLIDKSTTDLGKDVAEKEYMKEVANMGLAALGGLDPTGIFWMVSQFVQPICAPTSFIGEIDDGNLYDALGMWTVDEAFVGSYGSWTKKGDGVVSLIFESTDKEDVTVVIYSGGDEYAKVDVGAGDTVKWSSTVSELQAKTLYLDRGGSLVLWVPKQHKEATY
ncbi:Jacalin-like lectin domain [Phytophthora cactorum]|nr:Jacalin-like lectin domain [Phytophthora cactorum]